jgi:hypothetical protein
MGICDSNVTGPCKPCWTFARPAQHSRPPLSLMVGEGYFFSVLERAQTAPPIDQMVISASAVIRPGRENLGRLADDFTRTVMSMLVAQKVATL